jgi:hypothetical protein
MSRELTTYLDVVCWCDAEHALTLTGVVVGDITMAQAQSLVSIVTDVWPDDGIPVDLRLGDRRRLADAVAYQAAWMFPKPDLFAEMQAANVSQDGVAATYVSTYSQFLAPLAQVCINRLSWNRGGLSQKPTGRRPFANADAARAAVLRDEACDNSGTGGFVPGRPFT